MSHRGLAARLRRSRRRHWRRSFRSGLLLPPESPLKSSHRSSSRFRACAAFGPPDSRESRPPPRRGPPEARSDRQSRDQRSRRCTTTASGRSVSPSTPSISTSSRRHRHGPKSESGGDPRDSDGVERPPRAGTWSWRAAQRAVSLAGIMGLDTAVTQHRKRASRSGVVGPGGDSADVAKTRHHTDASHRFERGANLCHPRRLEPGRTLISRAERDARARSSRARARPSGPEDRTADFRLKLLPRRPAHDGVAEAPFPGWGFFRSRGAAGSRPDPSRATTFAARTISSRKSPRIRVRPAPLAASAGDGPRAPPGAPARRGRQLRGRRGRGGPLRERGLPFVDTQHQEAPLRRGTRRPGWETPVVAIRWTKPPRPAVHFLPGLLDALSPTRGTAVRPPHSSRSAARSAGPARE